MICDICISNACIYDSIVQQMRHFNQDKLTSLQSVSFIVAATKAGGWFLNVAKVMALGLHCSFHALTGRGLEQFVPKISGPERESLGRASVTGFDLPPWDERPCAKSCHDEEAAGFKMMNFLAGPCQLRCYPEPEGSHPQWNDYLRSVDQAGLKPVLLKATLLCNWTRGPFSKGTHQTRLSDAATDLMNRKGHDDEFMNVLTEMTAVDRGFSPDSDFRLTPDEWLRVCSKRIPKARGKAWFGIAESFSQLERSWSILSETVRHIKTLHALLKATWHPWLQGQQRFERCSMLICILACLVLTRAPILLLLLSNLGPQCS